MPAMVTPFADDESLDLDAHAANIATLYVRGVEGFLIAGSTGEGPYLEPGERRQLISAAVEAAPSATIIGGVHAESLRAARAAVNEVADGGAAAALVVTPTSSVRGRTPLVMQFYRDVADSAPLPIMLYSVPSVTAWELPVEAVNDLAGHANIVGMKDSGGDASRLPHLEGPLDDGFVVWAGASRAVLESRTAGAHGAITASANYAYPLVARAVSGDTDAQASLTGLTSIVESHGIPGAKAAAHLTGLVPGKSRRPLRAVSSEIAAEIEDALGRFLGS